MPSTVNWVIVPCQGGFNVNTKQGGCVANLRTNGNQWMVIFSDRPELDFSWGSSKGNDALDVCFGYVRGIERCQVLAALDE